jgi:dolichol-phosphate mannosyltransferase
VKLLVVIPTYNEADNIETLLRAVFVHIPPGASVLVVDDNSPDGTAKLAEKTALEYPGRLHILNRPEKQGLAAAYLAGFSWGLERDYDVFLEMDADFSHNPAYIPAMLEQIQSHDVVIGSRNVKGGGTEGWTFRRKVISKGGSLYSRLVLGCPVRDLTGGYNMWRKTALERAGLSSIISKGYLFQIEMKYKAYRAGCSIAEVPIVFTDRKRGASKMSKHIFFEALLRIWKIRSGEGIGAFVRFAAAGALGSVTNLIIFFILSDMLRFPEIPVSVLCFMIAVTQNYIINQKWSFRRTSGPELSPERWALFAAVSLAGLAVNVAVMRAVIVWFAPPRKVIAQGAGIAAGMGVNFVMSTCFVFRR